MYNFTRFYTLSTMDFLHTQIQIITFFLYYRVNITLCLYNRFCVNKSEDLRNGVRDSYLGVKIFYRNYNGCSKIQDEISKVSTSFCKKHKGESKYYY